MSGCLAHIFHKIYCINFCTGPGQTADRELTELAPGPGLTAGVLPDRQPASGAGHRTIPDRHRGRDSALSIAALVRTRPT